MGAADNFDLQRLSLTMSLAWTQTQLSTSLMTMIRNEIQSQAFRTVSASSELLKVNIFLTECVSSFVSRGEMALM